MAETRKLTVTPLLIRLTMWAAALYALWAFTLLVLAASSDGLTIGEQGSLDSHLWLQLLGPLYLVKGCLMAGVSYAIYKHKSWSRHLIISLWSIVGIYALTVSKMVDFLRNPMRQEMIQAIIFGAIAAWYFYRKGNVVRYFASLK